MNAQTWVRDTAEKALSTIVQAAIVFVIAADRFDVTQWKALLAAIIPGVLNVVKQAFAQWMPNPQNWLADTAVRAVWTFVLVALGAATAAAFDVFSASAWQAAAAGGAAAAIAVVKAALARLLPGTISPASLAKPADA
jgi:hypothetical protein